MTNSPLISLHGGHSGEFCRHAEDSLGEVVAAYRKSGFSWVGITEHMPPVDDRFLYPDERAVGLTAKDLLVRFDAYIATCRRLRKAHAQDLKLLVGFETEAYSGAFDFTRTLMERYRPDYIVGSVHHVDDVNFDFDRDHYDEAVRVAGGLDRLYHRYFDIQFEMINQLRPGVVGHFDLIRIYDPEYPERIQSPEIAEKIDRNLSAVKKFSLILDLNMRALFKGAPDPYPALPIIRKAQAMQIPMAPGDDSHGVTTVGNHIETGIKMLEEMGFDTNWEEIIRSVTKCPAA
jgi:histidinol-phosphatase (PHP family)